jgi:hypothetical protein
MPTLAVDICIYISIYLDKDVERQLGRKNYLVHNMRQKVAMILFKNTTATKPVSGRLEGER